MGKACDSNGGKWPPSPLFFNLLGHSINDADSLISSQRSPKFSRRPRIPHCPPKNTPTVCVSITLSFYASPLSSRCRCVLQLISTPRMQPLMARPSPCRCHPMGWAHLSHRSLKGCHCPLKGRAVCPIARSRGARARPSLGWRDSLCCCKWWQP